MKVQKIKNGKEYKDGYDKFLYYNWILKNFKKIIVDMKKKVI